MDALSYKTQYANKSTVQKEWWVVDAEDMVLGRLCSEVAKLIRGKHKPSFTPNVDCGDKVVVINADKIRLTGKKWTDREIIHHSGHPGGQKRRSPREVMEKDATKLIEIAVKGMLPKSRLGREVFKNLHVVAGPEHNFDAQQPKELKIN